MKHTLFIFFSMLLVLSVQAQEGFIVKAKINNPGNHTLGMGYMNNGRFVIDTSYTLKNGWAIFKGNVSEPVVASFFVRGNPNLFIKSGQGVIPGPSLNFFLSNDEISIRGDADRIFRAKVKGGQANNEWNQIRKKQQIMAEKNWQQLKKAHLKAGEGDSSLLHAMRNTREEQSRKDAKLRMDFIRKNPGSLTSMYFLTGFMNELPIEELNSIYTGLNERHKTSTYGKTVAGKIESVRATAIGKKAVPIQKKDMNGMPVNLETLKGKYVLLDFWGSWCGPCRQGHPHLKDLYSRYKSKGFEIVGIAQEQRSSLEENKKTWLEAIEKDGIPWIQVLNNEGISAFDAVKAYGITAFPTKILLDKEGKIIARYVGDDEALDNKLKELFAN